MAMTIGEYRRSSKLLLIALLCALLLALFSTLTARASTVSIDDAAKVLDAARVQTEAAKLPSPVLIYTTRIFVGEQDAFNQTTRQRLTDQRTIAIGIDVVHRHLSIQSGTDVKLSDAQVNDAIDAFRNNYNNGDYTGAILASLNSLHDSLTGTSSDSIWLENAVIVLLCLGIPGAIIFLVFRNRRNRNNPPRNGGRRNQDYNAAYYAGNHSNVGNYSSYHGGGSNFGGGGSFGGGGGGGSF